MSTRKEIRSKSTASPSEGPREKRLIFLIKNNLFDLKKVVNYGIIYGLEISRCPDCYRRVAPITFFSNGKVKKAKKKSEPLPDVWIHNESVYSIFEIESCPPQINGLDHRPGKLILLDLLIFGNLGAPQMNYPQQPPNYLDQNYMPNNPNVN